MTTSKLSLAYWLVWITGYGSFLLAGLFFFIGIHFSVQPDVYEGIHFSGTSFSMEIVDGEHQSGGIPEHSLPLVWLALARAAAFFVLVGLMSILGMRIIRTVRNGRVFSADTPQRFRYIGYGFLLMTAIAAIDISLEAGATAVGLELKLGYLLASLFAFILAEIFREGNRLEEESKLTV